jgi:hypothetical protein
MQVVSEAADACAYAMLAYCPSQRLLPKLCTTICSDRNGRLRQTAADYLLRVLESWEPADYERQIDGIQQAVLAAAQDAQADTRAAGRSMYSALAHACPSVGQALLARAGRDKQLQEKLVQAAEEYVPGEHEQASVGRASASAWWFVGLCVLHWHSRVVGNATIGAACLLAQAMSAHAMPTCTLTAIFVAPTSGSGKTSSAIGHLLYACRHAATHRTGGPIAAHQPPLIPGQ